MSPETLALYAVLNRVPKGKVVTYGHLAELSGRPGAARWAGMVLKNLPKDTKLPWHRVINSQGRISQPGEHGEIQRSLLEKEQILFENNKINLKTYLWRP